MLQTGIPFETERCERMKNTTIMKPYTLILVLLLTACKATTAPPPSAPLPVRMSTAASCPPVRKNSELGEIVSYYTRISALSPQDVSSEYDAASRNFSNSPSNAGRIRLAMLLSLPNTSFHSTTAARDLLDAWPEKGATDLRDFARFFSSMLAGQQQADQAANDLGKALASEKMHSKSLQGKIDAIKAFEANRREQP